MAIGTQGPPKTSDTSFKGMDYMRPLILVTSLFFMWAIAHNLNDVLIRQFQKALDLTRGQSGFIQSAFYLGYFTMALPAGFIMKKYGFKSGIIIGLLLFALGALLFYPAAEIRVYAFFLIALYIIAAGLTFLETAANPYITVLGKPETSETRLNLAQAFNGVGGIMSGIIGGSFIFSGKEYTKEQIAKMSPEDVEAFRSVEAKAVQMPYLTVAIIVILIAVLIWQTKFPVIKEDVESNENQGSQGSIFKHKHLILGVLTQFFYVGAQVGIWSFFIDYMKDLAPHVSEVNASYYLSGTAFLFAIGRFAGTALMQYFKPANLLSVYALISAVLAAIGVVGDGMFAVYCVMAISFFMSIMFPTIFALGIKNLGGHTKIGSSLIIMSIVGGAIIPPVMGYISNDNIKTALIVPAVCFLVVLFYGLKGYKTGKAIA